MKLLIILILFLCYCKETKSEKNSNLDTRTVSIEKSDSNKKGLIDTFNVDISLVKEKEYYIKRSDSLYFNFQFQSLKCNQLEGFCILNSDSLIIIHNNTNSLCERRRQDYNVKGVIPFNNNQTNFLIRVLNIDKYTGTDYLKGGEKFSKRVTFIEG